ncbi:MAG TPA: PAS domain S-box protein, partial [Chthoniobacteraceae bacterium]
MATVEEVLITEELKDRPAPAPNWQAESKALLELAGEMAERPSTLLQRVAEIALGLCQADSTGVSILESEGQVPVFRWHSIAGDFAPNLFGTLPQNSSPSGTVVDRNRVLLFERPDRAFPNLQSFQPGIFEALLVPFHVRHKPVGTLWAVTHRPGARFHSEHARLLASLARFASAAYSRFGPARSEEEIRAARIAALNLLEDAAAARDEIERTRKALTESEERFHQFAENSADVFWIFDAETEQVEYLNPAFDRIWGERRSVILQDRSRWIELVHPEDRPGLTGRLSQLKNGQTDTAAFRIIRPPDGKTRWIRDTGFPIRDNDGRVTRVAGVSQDVTEDRERTEAIRTAEERFRLLVEGAKDYAMFLLDRESIITYWSSGAERLFGWNRTEAEGQTGALIFTPEDRARGAVEEEIGTAVKTGRAPDRRWHLRKDGSRLYLDGALMRLDNEKGELRGFAKIARDATDQRRIEEEIRHARDELEQRVLERTTDLMATNNELERAMKEREQLEHELLEISERERRRIGQDLHDVVCQELTATALFLKSSGVKAPDANTAHVLDEAAEIVNRNVAIARDLARGFQPTILRAGGLTEALRGLCKIAHQNQPPIACELKLPRNIRVHDETIALNLYRIAQEAVRNSVSHSGADKIVICIEREKTLVRLVVEDDGR